MIETAKEMFQFLIESFRTYSGDNNIWLLYPAALLVILILGKKEDRKLFFGVLAVECLTIFNPFFTKLLLEKFGFSNRFLRFFWMLLFYIAIAYAVTLLIFRSKKIIWRVLSAAVCLVLVVTLGTPVFWGKDAFPYEAAENSYFIGEEVLALANILHSEGKEKPKVLMNQILLSYCQYDPGIESFLSRNLLLYLEKKTMEEFLETDRYSSVYKKLMQVFYYGDYSVPVEKFCRCLKKKKIDYVVSPSEALDSYLSESGMEVLGYAGNYTVWKVDE